MDKVFYKIGEVSEMTGLAPYVLRFWEAEFPTLHPQKSRGNQRLYTRAEIDTILRIKQLLYEERLTIAGARKRIDAPFPSSQRTNDVPILGWIKGELESLFLLLKNKSGRSAVR